MDGISALALLVRAPTDAFHLLAAIMINAARRFFPCHDETLATASMRKKLDSGGVAGVDVAKIWRDGERKMFVFGHSLSDWYRNFGP